MLDVSLLKKTPEEIEEKLKGRDPKIDLSKIIELINKQKEFVSQSNKEMISVLEEEIIARVSELPAIPHDSVPISQNKEDYKIISGFKHKSQVWHNMNHVDICKKLDMIDFEKASLLSGPRFVIYKGDGARLERALINFMLDKADKAGYTLISPPFPAVRERSLFTAGVLPKFEDQVYKFKNLPYYLMPTAEILLCSIHMDTIFLDSELPRYYASYTSCFRREAGAAGKEERGLLRIHQFNKVELVKITKPEDSYKELELLIKHAGSILEDLGLHYIVSLLPTSDIAYQATKAYDLMVWLPGQNKYYEVSTCSNCEDYQARRGNIRFKEESGDISYVHTLNGSGLATSRLFAAIIETYYQEDGSITIPEVLIPYLNNH